MTDTELARRLEKLERDNRRLKRLAGASLGLIVTAGIAYAVSCSSARKPDASPPSSETITAREFRMVDSAGNVRVKVAMECPPSTECRPEIRLFGQNGKPLTSLDAGKLTLSGEKQAATLLDDRLQFSIGPEGSPPRLTAELGSGSDGGGLLSLFGNGTDHIRVDSNSPGIELQDSQGYTMNLGAVNLTTVSTGRTSPTTADSIVMFGIDKEHHLIWRAP